MSIRLGVNIDHVATVRNARGGIHPDPVFAALLAKKGGADGITAHLREDRRHIRDADLLRLKNEVELPLNFEMAATDEMIAIALKVLPNACCLVPENRHELTTEGGLDVATHQASLADKIMRLRDANIRVSLFIDPDQKQVEAAAQLSAEIVEFHTGRFCEIHDSLPTIPDRLKHQIDHKEDPRFEPLEWELGRLRSAIHHAHGLELECHAGHGLNFQTAHILAELPKIVELNIGHFLIGQAIYEGLEHAVSLMRKVIDSARPAS